MSVTLEVFLSRTEKLDLSKVLWRHLTCHLERECYKILETEGQTLCAVEAYWCQGEEHTPSHGVIIAKSEDEEKFKTMIKNFILTNSGGERYSYRAYSPAELPGKSKISFEVGSDGWAMDIPNAKECASIILGRNNLDDHSTFKIAGETYKDDKRTISIYPDRTIFDFFDGLKNRKESHCNGIFQPIKFELECWGQDE